MHDGKKVVKTKLINNPRSSDTKLLNGFFRKIQEDYFFFLLGRDGEPKSLQKVKVEV
jgi:hypothetical protein